MRYALLIYAAETDWAGKSTEERGRVYNEYMAFTEQPPEAAVAAEWGAISSARAIQTQHSGCPRARDESGRCEGSPRVYTRSATRLSIQSMRKPPSTIICRAPSRGITRTPASHWQRSPKHR
jgi:hypothetical protein